jgi:uncharacterized protein YdaU (DUF1376 family)
MADKVKSPAYQWYPKDILTSERVALLDLREEGAYRRALDFCWLNGSIPADPVKLSRLIGKNCTKAVAEVVKSLFVILENDPEKLIHLRLEEEREKQKQFSEKQRVNGERGGRPKKGLGFSGLENTKPKKSSSSPSSSSSSEYIGTNVPSESGDSGLVKIYNESAKDKEFLYRFLKDSRPQFAEPYVAYWNLFATEHYMPEVQKITDARRRKIKTRLKENEFVFTQIIYKASKSEMILSGNWFSFDWVIDSQKQYMKVIEGNYDNKTPTGKDDKPAVSHATSELKELIKNKNQGNGGEY